MDLYIVGSSANKLATVTSDTDICLVIHQRREDDTPSHDEALSILDKIRSNISGDERFVEVELIQAKVPLLKFKDRVTGVHVDLNIHNTVGIRNTRLLKAYAECDPRVAKLVLAVKLWARENGINSAHHGTLASYSLTLMVIQYLQETNPPVVPCYQGLAPFRFNTTDDFKTYTLHEDWPVFHSNNKMSLGQLFVGFLKYYVEEFNHQRSVVSIRSGHPISKETARSFKSPKNRPESWSLLGVEEPFDRTNTACAVYDQIKFTLIMDVFKKSFHLLKNGFNLHSVLPVPDYIPHNRPVPSGYPQYPPPQLFKP